MKAIFWSFFFIFVNFNLALNSHVLNLIPSFVGYLLLYRAAGDLLDENRRFELLRPFAVGMAVYTGILWAGDLLGVTGGGSWMDTILSLAATAVSLFVSWNVVQAIREMETARNADLNGASVRTAWFVLLAAQIAGYAAVFLLSAGLALLVGIAMLAGIVWFLAALWKSGRLYESLPPRQAGLWD